MEKQAIDPRDSNERAQPAFDVISLADVIDRPVYGRDDQELGAVVNVYADLISQRLAYALLEVGGFLGIGSRRILIPFAALGWVDDRLYLPVGREMLERAPEWDRSDVVDREYLAEVATYWDLGDAWRSERPIIGPGSRPDGAA